MKHFLKTLSAFLLVFALVVSVHAEPKAVTAYSVKVEKGYLAVRSRPAYDASNELAKLYTGDTFYVEVKPSGDYWYGYTKSGIEGYVNKNYLEAVSESDFDIASNLKFTPDGGDTILENDYFSLQFPAMIDWDYNVINNTTLEIIYEPAAKSGFGGNVVTIMAYDWSDNSYTEFPDWALAGSDADKKYIALFPTDVQFDPNAPTQAEEYHELFNIAQAMDCNKTDAHNLFKIKEKP